MALPEIKDWSPCTIRDGRFVVPCESLQKALNGGNGYHAKGLQHATLTNITTGEHSRSFIVLRSGPVFPAKSGGVVVNFCPFCGTEICGPARDAHTSTSEAA